MLEKFIRFSLRNRHWVLGAFVLLGALGGYSLSQLSVDAVPDITNVQVVVNTKTGALDPEKIELLVTRPVEVEMTGLPGLEEIRSISKYGLSQVTLVFSDATNVYWARQQVSERLGNLRGMVPSGISPELAPVTTGLGEVFMYAVEAIPGSSLSRRDETQRLTELRTLQDYTIAPQLKRVSGVADIDSNGGYVKQVHVNYFPSRLEEAGLTSEMLVTRLETLGENFGGGYIQRQGKQIIVRTVPGVPDLATLKEFPLGLNVRGAPIRLSEVADIRMDHSLRVGAATRNGKETVLGTVLMRTGANSRQVAIDVESALKKISLPEGVRLVPLYTRSFLVDSTIHTVERSLLEGAVLVIVVLFLLLGHLRAALIVASAIPLSMLFAAMGMKVFGVSANLMSLGAIDFGLIVDGSVVLIENVLSRLQATSEQGPETRTQVIEAAAVEVIRPIVFGLVLIMAVYVPVLSLSSIEGKMFRPMAITVLLALGASLLITIFVMPALADTFLSFGKARGEGSEHADPWLFRIAKRVYLPVLRFSFRFRWALVGGAAALLAVSVGIFSRMGSNFIPSLDEGDLVITVARDPQEGIDASILAQRKIEETLARIPEVERVFSRIGTPESATDPMGVYLADTFVILKKDRATWNHRTKAALTGDILRTLTKEMPGQQLSATQPIEMRFNEMLEGSRADVTLRILGPNLDILYRLSALAKVILGRIPGAGSVETDPLTALEKSPMLDIVPNYASLARYGVTLGDLNRSLELAMGGKEVGNYFENAIRFPIVVHLDESLRDRPDVIASLPIALAQGGTIPLSLLSSLRQEDRVTTIARYWSERYAAVSVNLAGRDVSSFVEEARQTMSDSLKLPPGYRFYWGGQFKNLARARLRLWIIVPLTLLAIFLVLLRALNSFPRTALVFASIPLATVGGILALWGRGISFSISAAVGFIALVGIALLNAIVLIHVFDERLRRPGANLRASVEAGAMARLRPVLMTALVASLGFLPMALNTGIGAEVQRPLATVVIGGLVSSTLLTLVLLPPAFEWLERRRHGRSASAEAVSAES